MSENKSINKQSLCLDKNPVVVIAEIKRNGPTEDKYTMWVTTASMYTIGQSTKM